MNCKPLTDTELAGLKLKPRDLGRMVTARRAELGISEREMAIRAGVSQATVSRWEHGEITSTTVKMLNVLLDDGDRVNDIWRRRALIAEATLRDLISILREYREGEAKLKHELLEHTGGPRGKTGLRVVGREQRGSSSPSVRTSSPLSRGRLSSSA